MQKSCAGDRVSKGCYGRAFGLSGRVTDLLVRVMATMLRSRELVPPVSAPIRSRLDKRFHRIHVGYLNLAPRCEKAQRGA